MHVDGFRFDCASILTRDSLGGPLPHPPILEAMAADPIIRTAKWIAEPWDSGGLLQIGLFSKSGPWSEWNMHFRDVVRRFIKGDEDQVALFGKVLTGSEELYRSSKTPLSSINYITSHDGFSLRDLVSYEQKHNEENGEGNRDGLDQNESWNCGAEGPIENKEITDFRERQMRNFLLSLFVSLGTPMLLMGDEYGHTRCGNNNPYAQDNRINWFLWDQLEKNKQIFSFVSALIAFRNHHPSLHHPHFLSSEEIEWHGATPFQPDWGKGSRLIAFTTKEKHPLYVAFNASAQSVKITLPPHVQWHKVVNTAEDWSQHSLLDPDRGVLISSFDLPSYSALLAKGCKF